MVAVNTKLMPGLRVDRDGMVLMKPLPLKTRKRTACHLLRLYLDQLGDDEVEKGLRMFDRFMTKLEKATPEACTRAEDAINIPVCTGESAGVVKQTGIPKRHLEDERIEVQPYEQLRQVVRNGRFVAM